MGAVRSIAGFGLLAVSLLSSVSAFAMGLYAPLSTDTAAVLPKGVRSIRLAGFSTEVENHYDGYGSVVPLAYNFNKPVSVAQLIQARPSAAERGLLKGGLEAEGVNPSDIAGNSQGLVNAHVNSVIPIFAYGVTDRVTLGIGAPIVNSSTHVGDGWTVSPDFQDKINALMKNGYGPKLMSFKPLLNNVVTTRIQQYGYQPMVDENHTDIGDLNIGVKVLVYSNDRVAVALAPRIIAPTGRVADLNKVVDLAPGDGHWDLGMSALTDYEVTRKITITGSVGYTYQVENSQAVRVPLSSAETISPDIDWQTQVKQGDLMGAGLSGKYHINDLMIASLGYSLQYKNPDSFSGGQYTPDRYQYLAIDTFEVMQAMQIALTTTTVPLFKAGVFSLPMDATIAYSHVLDGRNISMSDIGVLEVAAYF